MIKAKTKNGKIVNEEGISHKKFLLKLEHQVQMAKTKLSAARGENASLKSKIDQIRMDKLLYMQILRDVVSNC